MTKSTKQYQMYSNELKIKSPEKTDFSCATPHQHLRNHMDLRCNYKFPLQPTEDTRYDKEGKLHRGFQQRRCTYLKMTKEDWNVPFPRSSWKKKHHNGCIIHLSYANSHKLRKTIEFFGWNVIPQTSHVDYNLQFVIQGISSAWKHLYLHETDNCIQKTNLKYLYLHAFLQVIKYQNLHGFGDPFYFLQLL